MKSKKLPGVVITLLILLTVIAGAVTTFGGIPQPPATPVTMSECQQIVTDAEPLLAAIRRYEKRTGHLPKLLDELVPQELPKVPTPRIASGHYYLYGVESNQWRVAVPLPGVKNDVLMYSSIGDYEKNQPGFGVERIGAWARYHDIP